MPQQAGEVSLPVRGRVRRWPMWRLRELLRAYISNCKQEAENMNWKWFKSLSSQNHLPPHPQ